MADYTITVDSSQIPQARQELKLLASQSLETLRITKKMTGEDRLAQHFMTIDKQISQVNRTMAQANRRFSESQKGARNFEIGIQQAGYQIGDFAVQVQSGTNPLVAFSQQFSQLVGFMGPWGAAFGAFAAIVAGIGVYFMKTSEDVDVLKTSMDDLAKSTQSTKDQLLALQLGFDSSGQAKALREIITLEIEAARIRQESVNETDPLRAQYLANQALSLEQQAQQARKLLEEDRAINEQLREAQQHADLVAKGLEDATIAAMKAAGINFNNISDAAIQAGILAQNLHISYTEALKIRQQQEIEASGKTYSGRGGDPRVSNQQGYGEFQYNGPALDINNNPIVKSSAGSRASQIRKEIDLTKELTQAERDRQTIVRSIESSLESGFMSMVEGTKSVKDAFKQMAYEIIRELYRVLVVQRMVGSILNIAGITMAPTPTTTSMGTPNFYGGGRASGGSVMTGGAYLVGENGPEVIVPRHSGTVLNSNQTDNLLSGSSSGFTVQNNITVTGSDAAMVRAEVAKMIPQITTATKNAVIDARLRGGKMKQAFS